MEGQGGMLPRLREKLSGAPAMGHRQPILLAPFFAGGAAIYMTLPFEPAFWLVIAAVLMLVIAALLGWRLERLRWPLLWLLAGGAGFLWCMLRTDWAEAPRLAREQAGEVSGIAAWIEATENRPRLELRNVQFDVRGKVQTLVRVRVRLGKGARPAVGDRVRVRAVLRPPPRPVAPGGYDFQRSAYFKQIGAVGFAIGPADIARVKDSGGARRWVSRARAGFRDQVYGALGDKPNIAGIITALTIGDRSGVVDADRDALRASGLAHLLAISGLHLGLAATAIFFVVRLLLALPHGAALRMPIHKIAAMAAILAAAGYLAMSGAAPPAQRAFVMVVAGMLAVMADRLRSGLWFVAWAAVIVVAVSPDVVAGPSFQLSFAAVTGIIAAYEAAAVRRQRDFEPMKSGGGLFRSMGKYVGGIAGASLIATAATAPLALAHFQQAPALGVIANLAAMPLMAFWIMPAAILAALLSPVGLGGIAFQVMGFGVELVLQAAYMVHGWDGGVIHAAASPFWVVGAFMGGGVLICAWRGWTRWLGLIGVGVAVVGLWLAEPPDILVDEQGRIAAVRVGQTLYVTSLRRGAFEQKAWARFVGGADVAGLAAAPITLARCDETGCVIAADAAIVAISTAPHGLPDDCAHADFTIALYRASAARAMGCPNGRPEIDAFDLARKGAHAIWIKGGIIKTVSVSEAQGDRAWSSQKSPNRP